jgi:hypothetical protein
LDEAELLARKALEQGVLRPTILMDTSLRET